MLRGGGPGGAGGAGNPLGGSFTGAAETLEIYGDFCAAYSGSVIVANSTVTCLNFQTGNHIIVAEFTQSINYKDIGQGQLVGFSVELNDSVITQFEERVRSYGGEESVGLSYYRFIIPPYTQVTTNAYTDDGSDNPFFHTITGRIYRG